MKRAMQAGALALAMVALAPAGEAQVVDCWVLDAQQLGQARAQGLCGDVFARNSDMEVAEAERNAVPPAPPPAETPGAALLRGLGREVRSFVTDLDQDFRAIGRALRNAGGSEPIPHR